LCGGQKSASARGSHVPSGWTFLSSLPIARLETMLGLIDKTLDHSRQGRTMNAQDIFGDFDPGAHADEARERWGETESYRESARRTARYGQAEWAQLGAESGAIEAELQALMQAGVPADDPRAMDAAERHRLHIDRWFYPCAFEMHVGLAEMYVADERFTRHYDQRAPGLAIYVHDAIVANAARRR